MKKTLLLAAGLSVCLPVVAQQATSVQTASHSAPIKVLDPDQPGAPFAANHSKVASSVLLGTAANAYSTAYSGKTYLVYNAALNTLLFTHRSIGTSLGDFSSGAVRYDISTDGGVNWSVNQGPVWNPDGSTKFNARYPQGVLYNPTGNTNPTGAYLVLNAPVLSGTNDPAAAGGWGGLAIGDYKLDGTDNNVVGVETNPATNTYYLIPEDLAYSDALQKTMGIGQNQDLLVANDYLDSLLVNTGTWNSGTSSLSYSYSKLSMPVGLDPTDSSRVIADARIAFGPTGTHQNTVYVSALGYNQTTVECYAPIVRKSTDGGATFGPAININLDALVETGSGTNLLTFIQNETSAAGWIVGNLSTAFEHDLIVDANGNPHILVNICPAAATSSAPGGTLGTPFSIFSFNNYFVDIYSLDGGTTWNARKIGDGQTFRGTYGGITEDNRPQISRDATGSVLFFAWFDTDTTFWGPGSNTFPDCWVNYYNTSTGTFGTPRNLSGGGLDFGTMNFGVMSTEVITTGTDQYIIPVVSTEMSNGDPQSDLLPVQFKYNGFAVDLNAWNIGVEELPNLTAGELYPNPARETAHLAIQLANPQTLNLEVTNLLGQKVYHQNLGLVTSGENKIAIPVKGLTPGIYLVYLGDGNQGITKKLVVE